MPPNYFGPTPGLNSAIQGANAPLPELPDIKNQIAAFFGGAATKSRQGASQLAKSFGGTNSPLFALANRVQKSANTAEAEAQSASAEDQQQRLRASMEFQKRGQQIQAGQLGLGEQSNRLRELGLSNQNQQFFANLGQQGGQFDVNALLKMMEFQKPTAGEISAISNANFRGPRGAAVQALIQQLFSSYGLGGGGGGDGGITQQPFRGAQVIG